MNTNKFLNCVHLRVDFSAAGDLCVAAVEGMDGVQALRQRYPGLIVPPLDKILLNITEIAKNVSFTTVMRALIFLNFRVQGSILVSDAMSTMGNCA